MISIVNRRGQATIPKCIRDRLRLLPGSAVEFLVNASGEAVLHLPKEFESVSRIHLDRFDEVRGTADVPWRTDRLMKLLRTDD